MGTKTARVYALYLYERVYRQWTIPGPLRGRGGLVVDLSLPSRLEAGLSIRNLEALFSPSSIALIGASNRPGSVGYVLARNLFDGGFAGPILTVNPKERAIRSTLNYRSVSELPLVPDLAVITTPPQAVAGLVGELGERGCRAVIVITQRDQSRMKPLVIFDMDGVLIDSEPIHMQLERDLFRQLALPISDTEHEAFVGMSPDGMWTAIKERFGLSRAVDELVAMEAALKTREIASMNLAPIGGVERLLRALEENGCALAIASSSSKALIDAVLAKLNLGSYFAQTVSAEEVARGKPPPDIFLRAARLCGRSPARCLVIEDSRNGVRAAVAAGMKCVGFRNRHSGEQDLSGADCVIEAFDDAGNRQIMELLRRLYVA